MRKKKGSGCRVLPDKCFERLAEFSGAFPDRIEGFSLPVNKIPQPLCLLYNPSIEPMLSFQVLNLINEVYSLVQDVALSFRIQESPDLFPCRSKSVPSSVPLTFSSAASKCRRVILMESSGVSLSSPAP